MTDSLQAIIELIIRDLIHKHGTQSNVAKVVGIAEDAFSRKLSGQSGWSPKEIAGMLSEGGYTLVQTEELAALKVFAKKGISL